MWHSVPFCPNGEAPKYRKAVLRGDIVLRLRDSVCGICRSYDVGILKGLASRDHVHFLVSNPPALSLGRIMQTMRC
ncbi:MAG: transposase [Thermoguttaceae bacterium]|nr:transposase [Thermoguttaceae bacterium]